MAAKLILLAVETWNSGTGATTGAVKVADIVDYRTYVNDHGETVSLIETTSGMLPAIAITQSYSANVASLPAPEHTAANVPTAHATPTVDPLGDQYRGSSFP